MSEPRELDDGNHDESLDDLVKDFGHVNPMDIQLKLTQETQDYARELVTKSIEAGKTKQYLTNLNKRIQELQYKILPDLFNQQDITRIATNVGIELEMSPYYKASLPLDMDPQLREEAFAYLRENAPDLIKTQVLVEYEAREHELAVELMKILSDLGVDPSLKEDVHWATLTSWVKEQFLAGADIPFGKLNAKVGSVVKIHKDKEETTAALRRLRKHEHESNSDPADQSRENQEE